tara:strand:- start:7 stop:213 length:207 start_codon:yes stop_codon:yes gene_type:complete
MIDKNTIVSVKKMLAPEDNKTLINYKVTDAETQANSRIQKFVAIDNDNADYQEILAWVAAGNTIEEAD